MRMHLSQQLDGRELAGVDILLKLRVADGFLDKLIVESLEAKLPGPGLQEENQYRLTQRRT